MKKLTLVLLLILLAVPTTSGQETLTTNQRRTALTQLASMYAKNYAPYEWKRDVAERRALALGVLRKRPKEG